PLVDALREEFQVVGALVEQHRKDVLEERLGEIGISCQIGERDLRLNHPELGQMPRRVAILGAECWAERVDLRQRQTVRLDVELSTYGQKRFLAKKVLREVGLAIRGVWNRAAVEQVECADSKHLAGALGIARGDDRRVYPEKAPLMKVAVHGHAQRVPHTGNCAKRIRPWAQMRDLAQVFERGLFGLNRIAIRVVDPSDYVDGFRLKLHRLPLTLACRQRAGRDQGAARRDFLDFALIVRERGSSDHLEWIEAGPVVEVNERQASLRIPARADPAAHGNMGPRWYFSVQYRRNIDIDIGSHCSVR